MRWRSIPSVSMTASTIFILAMRNAFYGVRNAKHEADIERVAEPAAGKPR